MDVLVNNVGNFHYKTLGQTTAEEWNEVFESNLTSVWDDAGRPSDHAKTALRSGDLLCGGGCGPRHYARSNHSLRHRQGWRSGSGAAPGVRGSGAGITVNCISPGVLETSVAKQGILPPIGRYIQFEDILRTIAFYLDSPCGNWGKYRGCRRLGS